MQSKPEASAILESFPDVDGFGVKPMLRNQYPGQHTGHVFTVGFDQLTSGVHQESGKFLDFGGVDFSGAALNQTMFVGFYGTEDCFLAEKKFLAPNMGASIKV